MPITAFKSFLLLMRLDKPIGILLLLFPCWWGVAYIQKGFFSLSLLVLFLLGAVFMRSAGCIINDILDKEVDKEVNRTKYRPLACNLISTRHAFILFFLLCLGGLGILLCLPLACWYIGIIGFLLLLFYPLCKRFTHFAQVCLGFAFNIGFLMGIVACTEALPSLFSWPVLLIYSAAVLWTVGYDTIYAVQDYPDDIRLGVHSTAVLFGAHTRVVTLWVYGLSLFLMIAGIFLSGRPVISPALTAGIYGWTMIKLAKMNLENPLDCRDFFIFNQWIGVVVFIALLF